MQLYKLSHASATPAEIADTAVSHVFINGLRCPEALLLKHKVTGDIYLLDVGDPSVDKLSSSLIHVDSVSDISGDFELVKGDDEVLKAVLKLGGENLLISRGAVDSA